MHKEHKGQQEPKELKVQIQELKEHKEHKGQQELKELKGRV